MSRAGGETQDKGTMHLDDEQELLLRYAESRSAAIREDLVKRLMPLARSLAMRYRRQTEPLDDLVQVASVGLVKAIDGFDPSRGRPFSAYAVPTILGELRRHFRDHVWNVRLPRGLQELTMRVDDATKTLAEELGRYPSPAQIAEHVGVSVEQVLEALEASHARRTLSLDAPRVDGEEATSTIETIADTERGYDRVEAAMASTNAGLDQREWTVLRLRFVEELTQFEIGQRLGVSQMQISRISRRALWKLLGAVRGGDGDAGPVPSSSDRDAA
jgi:RNA polymerase sigma-B factor